MFKIDPDLDFDLNQEQFNNKITSFFKKINQIYPLYKSSQLEYKLSRIEEIRDEINYYYERISLDNKDTLAKKSSINNETKSIISHIDALKIDLENLLQKEPSYLKSINQKLDVYKFLFLQYHDFIKRPPVHPRHNFEYSDEFITYLKNLKHTEMRDIFNNDNSLNERVRDIQKSIAYIKSGLEKISNNDMSILSSSNKIKNLFIQLNLVCKQFDISL